MMASKKKGRKAPPTHIRRGPSSNDPHEIVFFKRHRSVDPDETVPGREALSSFPTGVQAKLRARLVAVATAPPKSFSGGGYWEAMHGDMTGWFEVRADGPNRAHYRLFCLLDYDAEDAAKPYLVIVDGRWKPFRTTLNDADYEAVRKMGEEYRARNPRSTA